MNCANCNQEVTGEILTSEGEFKNGTIFVLILRAPDCDWLNCDVCQAVVHVRCYQKEDTRYCDRCLEKHKVFDIANKEVIKN